MFLNNLKVINFDFRVDTQFVERVMEFLTLQFSNGLNATLKITNSARLPIPKTFQVELGVGSKKQNKQSRKLFPHCVPASLFSLYAINLDKRRAFRSVCFPL